MSRWKKLRYRIEELACRALVHGVPLLSRGSCVRLARALGAVAFAVDRRGRAVALANLDCAFGERFTPAQRIAIARESYRNFARTMLDLVRASRLTAHDFRDYFRLEGLTRCSPASLTDSAALS